MAFQIENGTHFWAIMNGDRDGGLTMICKCKNGYFVCGAWEGKVDEKEFEIIEIVPLPEGYNETQLYYR